MTVSVDGWNVQVAGNTSGCPGGIRFTVEFLPGAATSGIHYSTTGDMSILLNSEVLLRDHTQNDGSIEIRVLVRAYFGNVNYMTYGKTFVYNEDIGSLQFNERNGGTTISVIPVVYEGEREYILLPTTSQLITCPDKDCTSTNTPITPITLGNNIFVNVNPDANPPEGHRHGPIITVRFQGKVADIVEKGFHNGKYWALIIANEVCSPCSINVTSAIIPITRRRLLLENTVPTAPESPMVMVSSSEVTVEYKFPTLMVAILSACGLVLVIAGIVLYKYKQRYCNWI